MRLGLISACSHLALRSFHSAYRNFVLQARAHGVPLYWAAGDISDCFTSIDHSILERTLRVLTAGG